MDQIFDTDPTLESNRSSIAPLGPIMSWKGTDPALGSENGGGDGPFLENSEMVGRGLEDKEETMRGEGELGVKMVVEGDGSRDEWGNSVHIDIMTVNPLMAMVMDDSDDDDDERIDIDLA
jgi:hypothetical protein